MRTYLFFLVLCFIAFGAVAQEIKESTATNQEVTVYLKDGAKLVGTFNRLTSDTLYFTHAVLGFQKIPLGTLKKFEFGSTEGKDDPILTKVETETFIRENGYGKLSHNRYFITPNGFGPKKGEFFFRSFYLLSNNITFGLNDHFSLSAGTNFLILPMASVKYRGNLTPSTSIGVQGGIISLPITDGQDSFALKGFFYGSVGASFGNIEKNISVGVGIADDVGSLVPFYFVGASIKLFDQMSLTFEMPYLGANLSGGEDIFAPILTPQFFLKRIMIGIGVAIIFEYFPQNQEWKFVQALPSANLSIKLGKLD